MNAKILRAFFIGELDAPGLALDVADPWVNSSGDVRQLQMTDLEDDFLVEPFHLIRLCDAVADGTIAATSLEAIGFGLVASDHFTWDTDTVEGQRVAETLKDWSSPETNYALTADTVAKFRHRLLTGENRLTPADLFKGGKPVRASRWRNKG